MKNKLILDFDGVISDSILSFCTVYNNKYKDNPLFKKADHNKLQRWDCTDECPLEKKAEVIFSSKEFFDNLEFMENAKEYVEKLSQSFHIIICSIGTFENISHKSLWIRDNMPFIKDTILITNGDCYMDKSIVNMKDSIFIDDNALNLDSSNADIKICFGKEFPYNKDWKGSRRVDWESMYNLICEVNIPLEQK